MKEITHSDLVESAARWLRKEHSIVITEMSGGWDNPERPDAIGWLGGGITTLIECKTSRSDFLADRKKPSRISIGMGTFKYYLAPEGVAYAYELPMNWGLLEYKNKRNRPKVVKFARQSEIKNWPSEMAVLCSALRRIGGLRKEGVSVKVYQWETKNTATLGIRKEEAK